MGGTEDARVEHEQVGGPDTAFLALAFAGAAPRIDSMDALRRLLGPHLPVVTSDVFTALEASDATMDAVGAHLVRNVDFGGWDRDLRLVLGEFARRQQEWFDQVPELFPDLRQVLPENLRGLERLTLTAIRTVALVDGIALSAVPRPDTAQALVDAHGSAERRDILGRRWRGIAADCRAVVQACTSEATRHHREAVLAALDALVADNALAAQALAAPVIDALCRSFFGEERGDHLPRDRQEDPTAFDRLDAASCLAFSPLWQTYQRFGGRSDDPVPYVFNAHASAHTVHPLQYSRRNAVQALMFATSILERLDAELA